MSDKMVLDHKWTGYGLGDAPFKIKGLAEMPSIGLCERNVDGYNNAMKMACDIAYPARPGTCDVCGRAIMINFVMESADGNRFVCGSECVRSHGNAELISEVDKMVRDRRNKMAREKRKAKREANRIARNEAILAEEAVEREKNGGLTDHELAEKTRLAHFTSVAAILTPVAELIEDGKRGFCDSIASDMKRGTIPYGRGFDLVCEITAKKKGRKNSNAYKAEFARIEEILTAAAAI